MNGATQQDRNKAIVRRLFEEIFQQADTDALSEVVGSDIVDHNPTPGQPAGLEGIRHVIRFLHAGVTEARFVVDDLIAEDDRVVARWRLTGTATRGSADAELLPPAGGATELGVIVIFRLENSKIVERWAAHQL